MYTYKVYIFFLSFALKIIIYNNSLIIISDVT